MIWASLATLHSAINTLGSKLLVDGKSPVLKRYFSLYNCLSNELQLSTPTRERQQNFLVSFALNFFIEAKALISG